MRRFLFLIFFFCVLLVYSQEERFDTTQEYVYLHYNKEKPVAVDNRNTMRLTCVYDGRDIKEYLLSVSYNSAERISVPKGQKLILRLFNGEYITLYSVRDITQQDNIAYKEQVKIRYKTFFTYRVSREEMAKILKHKVFEFKQYIFGTRFVRYGVRNVGVWEFDAVLERQFNELMNHISPYETKRPRRKDRKRAAVADFEVNTLFKEGRISYLEGDSLVKTDESIKFDIKWIE